MSTATNPLAAIYLPTRKCDNQCSTPECDARFRDELEMKRCEGCSKRFCDGCLSAKFPDDYVNSHGVLVHSFFYFCEQCAVCDPKKCGEPAAIMCDLCGDLRCAKHSKEYRDKADQETGYVDAGTICRPGCNEAAAIVTVAGNENELETCPF